MTRMNAPVQTKTRSHRQEKWRRLLDRLEERCLQPISDFRKLGSVLDTQDGPLIYIDKGSPILGVAHLDTVASKLPRSVFWGSAKYKDGSTALPVIQSIQLDDRLGAWMLLDLLPSMGMNFDVLLCDGEEKGRSTAEHFKPSKEYNWGFEFDRMGTGTVLYDYEDDDVWEQTLRSHGFGIEMGSFSDISSLTHVGCCFANFGVGYHSQHTHQCHAYLDDTVLMAMEFETWLKEQSDTRYPYTHNPRCVDYGFGWYRRMDRFTTHNNRVFNDDPWVAIFCPYCDQQNWTTGAISHKACVRCGKLFPIDMDKVKKESMAPALTTSLSAMPGVAFGPSGRSGTSNTMSVVQASTDECYPRTTADDIQSVVSSRKWDDAGVCEVCGYDQVMDMDRPDPLDPDIINTDDCPFCGRDLPDDGFCDYCGYTEQLA